MIRASMQPPLISGPSSSGVLYTRYFSTSVFSMRSTSQLTSPLGGASSVVLFVVCSSRSGKDFIGDLDSIVATLLGVGGGEALDDVDLDRLGGNAGGVTALLTGVDIELGDRRGDGGLSK